MWQIVSIPQVGLISWGDKKCGASQLGGVSTDVREFYSWILSSASTSTSSTHSLSSASAPELNVTLMFTVTFLFVILFCWNRDNQNIKQTHIRVFPSKIVLKVYTQFSLTSTWVSSSPTTDLPCFPPDWIKILHTIWRLKWLIFCFLWYNTYTLWVQRPRRRYFTDPLTTL